MNARRVEFPTAIVLTIFAFAAGCGAGNASNAATAGDAGSSTNDASVDAGDERGPSQVDSGLDGAESGALDGASGDADAANDSGTNGSLKTVFLILMANRDWATIKGSTSAPYLNALLASAAHAEQYFTPPANHPSEPNTLWLEAGSNLGIKDDLDPSTNHQPTTEHLVTLLTKANVSWKAYAEDISGQNCPLLPVNNFVPKHTPVLFFDDVTDTNSANSANCIAHVRPYTELAADLSSNHVARYNVITPNLCNDMAGAVGCGQAKVDEIKAGDTWLSTEVPKIGASQAYEDGGAIFIVWDQGTASPMGTSDDGPLGCVVLSPKAKAGYASSTKFTHSATLRTVQEIFGVTPLLGAAATSNDLSEMFTSFP